MPAALDKLVNVMGAERGQRLYAETLSAIGMSELATPNDSARFGNELISRGGVLASIGRAIKIQAILQGATADR